MSGGIEAWLKDDSRWRSVPVINKIDTHHHVVPDFYAKAVEDAGGDPSGWSTPSWSAESTLALMDRMGVRTAILSLTAPGACITSGEAASRMARRANEYCAALRDQHPDRLGFFVCLPSLLDTEAALAELRHGLDVLGGDGVVVFTRYGDGNQYLGNAALEPVWKELSDRRAVVFVHPTASADQRLVSPKLPQPLVDYTHETTRTAADMIMNGTRSRFPGCEVILSHAGGSLPYLINRLAMTSRGIPVETLRNAGRRTFDEMMKDFRSFHYDLALSAGWDTVDLLLRTVGPDKILYGTDYPYAPPNAYPVFLDEMEQCQIGKETRDKIYFGNAMKLFPRLDKVSARPKL